MRNTNSGRWDFGAPNDLTHHDSAYVSRSLWPNSKTHLMLTSTAPTQSNSISGSCSTCSLGLAFTTGCRNSGSAPSRCRGTTCRPLPPFTKGVHGLRHFAGEHYASQTSELRKVRDNLRHSSMSTSEIYMAAQDTDEVREWSIGLDQD